MYSFLPNDHIVVANFSYAGWNSPKREYVIEQGGDYAIFMNGRVSLMQLYGLPLNRNATSLFRMIEGRETMTVFGEAEFYVVDKNSQDIFHKKLEKSFDFWNDRLKVAQKIQQDRLNDEIDKQLAKQPTKSCIPKKARRKPKELDDLLKTTTIMTGKRVRRRLQRFVPL